MTNILSTYTQNTLTLLRNAFGPGGQAVYVIPEHAHVLTYRNDVDVLNALGYDTCFITCPGGSIGSVQVNGVGDLYLL